MSSQIYCQTMSRSAQGLRLYHSSFQERDLSNVIRSRTALKFNVDGASEDYCAYTGVGGILCDESGNFVRDDRSSSYFPVKADASAGSRRHCRPISSFHLHGLRPGSVD